MITVADLRAQHLLHLWHEAVAIVQELAECLGRQGPAAHVPDLEHVAVEANGELTILPGGPSLGPPVQQLARTLDILLDGTSAPPELRCLVSENTGETPKHGSIEEFARALATFERSGRRNDIVSIAARKPNAAVQSRMESELERLRTKTRESAQTRATETRASRSDTGPRRWRRPVAVAVFVLVVGTALPGVLLWRHPERRVATSSALQSLVARGEGVLTRLVRSGLTAISGPSTVESPLEGSDAPAVESPPASDPTRRSPDAPRSASVGGGQAQRRSGGSMRRAPPPASDREPPARPPLAFGPVTDGQEASGAAGPDAGRQATPDPWALSRAAPAIDSASNIYSASDPLVVPAVMRRLYLASVASEGGTGRSGEIEIVISETGAVERVRLISIHHFKARMLLAAAKVWKFQPALKDGRSVKYRLRVPVMQ